jgi:mono/diheme cytochrome c family protein
MRGTIEVSGSTSEDVAPAIPLYVALGIDIDKPHPSPVVPNTRPSAANGEKLAMAIDLSSIRTADFYRSHSPYEVFEKLAGTELSDPEKWDVIASIWRFHTTSESLASGKELYSQNCAACHGENGAGDGVFADDLAAAGASSMQTLSNSQEMKQQTPANFSDPERLLGASPALLQGKILRGGMGTGMPMWGAIFTEEQIWDLVSYLYSFQFDYEK